jgi:hypothetical protein
MNTTKNAARYDYEQKQPLHNEINHLKKKFRVLSRDSNETHIS